MDLRWLTNNGLILALNIILVSSVPFDPFDPFSDLRGPYCESIGCCNGRLDSCSVPIIGTLCYCDDFCNNTRVNDCCPDFWSYCKDIHPPPTTIRPELPGAIMTCRPYKDRTLGVGGQLKDNCNKCVCELARGQPDLKCETNECLVDPNIIKTINEDWGRHGWTASNYSEFWGRTLEDGMVLRLGTLHLPKFVLKMNPVRRIYDPNALPREFDSNRKWPKYITGIQDQGWCGSSWAISTAAVASDRYAILSEGVEKVQLSAQNLLSCDTDGQKNCGGGYLDKAWSFVRKFGLVDEKCFPYRGKNEKCTIKMKGSLLDAGCDTPPYKDRVARYNVAPVYRLRNETDIMHEITKSGPVQATMKIYHDFFSYKEGIYRHSYFASHQKPGYHSVRIVGWGEDGNQKYWKVANSWGTNWGEDGYFRIAKGINECEIESFVLGTWRGVEEETVLSNKLY